MTPTPSRRSRLATVALGLLTITLVPGLVQLPATAATPKVSTSTSDRPGPTPAVSTTPGDPVQGVGALDLRGSVLPTALQKQAARALGDVNLRWNAFGTPGSILPVTGSLGAAAGSPATGARSWLRSHASLLGITAAAVDDLDLVSSQAFADSPARAVLFRQRFGGLVPASGSMVTVGVADGRVAYVSSSLTRTTGTPPAATLSPLEGWLKAAASVGRAVPAGVVGDIVSKVSGGWTRLTVPGLADQQLVRLRALAMADGSVRPVLESNVLDAAAPFGMTVYVDGVTGKPLLRQDRVDNEVYNNVFTGTIDTATGCGPLHTFELHDALTKSITAVGLALPTDDVVVKFNGPAAGLPTTTDLLTAPEVATFSAATIPAGVYSVQICEFEPGAATVGSYAVTVSTSDTATPGGGTLLPNPRWRYFTANPTNDGPTQTPTNSVLGCWVLEAGCTTPPGELRNIADNAPWDAIGGLPTFTTVGNNANTHEAWANPLAPGGTLQAPVSPTREYDTEFTDAWNNSKCDPTQLVPGGNDINASVTNLFVAHNRMHDFSYYLGFTEANYNLQLDNGGKGGVGGDQEIGNAQAGALTGGQPSFLGRDNANQIALQDGVPGITNQYLFQPIAGSFYAPCTDGGLDMGIVGHEYTHAISNRMIGGPDDGITSEQGGAMGESWGDLTAGEYAFSHGYGNGGNPWAIGVYATGNPAVAIRDYAINKNPLNYSDYGFDTTGNEVHADGEIWNGTQWEVRQALVKKYNAQYPYADKALQKKCADGTDTTTPRSADLCPGNRRWIQLIFDAFLLQQGDTSMLDARDAMYAADTMRFGGKDLPVMAAAFARRGMGKAASTPDADSGDTVASFASAKGRNAKVTFKAQGIGKVYVGDYEARSTPVADTNPKSALKAVAEFTPGTYRMLFVSKGKGFKRFTLTVPASAKARTVVVPGVSTNLAAASSGAKVIAATEGSLNAAALIDGTETTNWGGVTTDNVDVSHPSVAVDLAGGVSTVRRIQVSAYLKPAPADPNELPVLAGPAQADDDPDSGSRFTALRKFAVEACTAKCATAGATWKRFYTSPSDAFPGTTPRPVAPNLTLRSFTVPATKAAAVRLVTLENQCTGSAEYAGEVDNDPLNDTDCKTGSDRGTIVHAAELQVFAAPAKARPTRTVLRHRAQDPLVKGKRIVEFAKVLSGAKRLGSSAGRLKVRIDGKVVKTVPVTLGKRVPGLGKGWTRIVLGPRITRRLGVQVHSFRLLFVPADRSTYKRSVSNRLVLKVRRG